MCRLPIAMLVACFTLGETSACQKSASPSSGAGGNGGTGGAVVATGGTGGSGGTSGPAGGAADGSTITQAVGTGGAVGGSPGTGGIPGQGGASSTGGTTITTVAVGTCDVPTDARAEPTTGATVVGDGTPASCTAAAFESAVQQGGVVTFNCGPDQVTINLDHQIKLLNNAGPDGLGRRVIDGGSKVVLSSSTGWNRLLYQDACDPSLGQVAGDCTNSPNPSLVIQNLALANAAATTDNLGGGALYLRGGSLKIFFSSFCNNAAGSNTGARSGGAIYAEHAYGQVYIVNSLFGGSGGCTNRSDNGGNLGGLSTSFTILNSRLTDGGANSFGGIPAAANTPGGGCGGAIFARGNSINLTICGSTISNNGAVDSAGAIYFAADDLLGTVRIDRSLFSSNGSRYAYTPSPGRAENGVFLQTAAANITITSSTFN